ncbi:lytic transglycosylase domain-containing protein [Nocardioides euryhalodurans]|uniref:Lytic transglycosylase domain-containing protein n=1 Tax=Nocardioides euryhalodurans TaxID=2518370 RepID=A0A4P7GKI8_9ACTN|nr:lytic transglycosylase domain-containing protein [Nocardioides euryhalodurans]QBR92191.1 lytic transglycosylase domain-containing protein [Nocardioides euryhalodurans]
MGDRRRGVAWLALACALPLTACSATDVRPEPAAETSPSEEAATRDAPQRQPRDAGRPPAALSPALEGQPVRPASPRQAAAQLLAADRAIQDPGTPPSLLAAAGHTQQLAARELASRPGWDERVGRMLPPRLRRDTAANVAARRAFRSMHPTSDADLATELPAWRIVRPRPAAELRRHYREAERRYGVDWEYLAAINLVETGFGRIEGTSVAGAQGPMQFIPTTWDIYGEGGDVRDPRDAILAAGRLLRANGFDRDPAAALYRYNNSTAYVRGVRLYAEVMQRRPRTYLGYHQWPIYYLTRQGGIWLPEGYAERRPVPVREWLARGR